MFKKSVRSTVLDLVQKKKQIIYGQRAINAQIPTHLKRKTSDYDIYSKKPESAARELLEELNKGESGRYQVKKAIYGRTWKVKDTKTGETIADYTQPSRHPKTKKILGVQYADTSSAKRKIGKILRDEKSKYRHDKDRDMLDRIKKGERKVW